MEFFDRFSRSPRAVSKRSRKRGRTLDCRLPDVRFSGLRRVPQMLVVAAVSGPAVRGNAAGIDLEHFAGCADFGESDRVGAGHPDLGAEFGEFVEQGLPSRRVEM